MREMERNEVGSQLEVIRLWFFKGDNDYWRTKKSRYRLIGRLFYIYIFVIMTITTILNEHLF
jgi:hypothetical protein